MLGNLPENSIQQLELPIPTTHKQWQTCQVVTVWLRVDQEKKTVLQLFIVKDNEWEEREHLAKDLEQIKCVW